MSTNVLSPTEALAQYLYAQTERTTDESVDSQSAVPHVSRAKTRSKIHAKSPHSTKFCVAYSGGMDSHVLLHAAAQLLNERPDITLRAVHIDHGLQAESAAWVRHAEFVCDGLNIPLITCKVEIDTQTNGVEAGARLARYSAFAEILQPGEQLLLAQHADDQAETFLLQALRGSGPDGLASIPRKRTFEAGYMARPLLPCSQQSLSDYAETHGLSWIEDPSNADTRFDRNFIRQEILPLLRTRWPAATQTLGRAAMRSAAASQTLQDVAYEDLALVRVPGENELSIAALNALTRERGYNAIRLWVRQAGLRMPRLQDLREVSSSLLQAGRNSSGLVNVRDYEFRRHRERLYLLPGQLSVEAFSMEWAAPYDDLLIEETGQLLSKSGFAQQGIVMPAGASIMVRSRIGGELIKLGQPAFHKAVKKVLQEAAIPPWQRDTVPLLYVDDRLVAVWNVVVSVDFKVATEIA